MILYTGGTFDIFHYGHMMFLRSCQKIASRVVVALNTDEFVQSYKAESTILSYSERYKSIKTFDSSIDVVENVGGYDSKPAILTVSPDIIAIGDDWCKRDYYTQMNFTQEWLDENGILLVYIPYTKNISTSLIKSKIISYQN
tara:strand:- start:369 stop:794 length:426 start_codon:yes stop_codon:yes gene_type:complete